ncbi:endonuclease/exonuclease/phosphatase family protein [Bacteroidales bacterium OttesenSCG-928-A17]|nr:endonuclease/exonuclease/phosphatase family protein [Bacteroidales bacterium OttesenSCG-928-A17]
MKKTVLIFILILSCVSTISAQTLRVASYNIRYENTGDAERGNGWKQRQPVLCEQIRFHDFDIFGAQEVLHGQLNSMLDSLPGYSYIGAGRDDGKTKGEYAPIFFKEEMFDMLKSGHFWLSEHTDYPNKGWDAVLPRICTWGYFKEKTTGFHFWFFNLHMDHVGVEARWHSSRLVLDKIREMCGNDAVILTGDFNVDQTNKSYEVLNTSGILRDSYTQAKINYSTTGTFNAFNPNLFTESRIDHIFVSSSLTVEKYGILTDTYRVKKGEGQAVHSGDFPKEVSLQEYEARTPSDHFPILVILSY